MTIIQLSLSYRHYLTSSLFLPLSPTFSSLCHYPRRSPLLVITRLDRVISSPSPPIPKMLRSSRSMTGWNGNYSTFPFLSSYPTCFSHCLYPRHALLSAITRLDRVIPLSLPILRMPRSSRSMTGWNDNYSTFPFLSSFPDIFSLPAIIPDILLSFCHYPT